MGLILGDQYSNIIQIIRKLKSYVRIGFENRFTGTHC